MTALGTLQALSLISAEKGQETFTMHRLVQLSVQHWLQLQNTEAVYQEEAVKVLSEWFPDGDPENWKECEALSLHARVVLNYSFTTESSMLHHATLLYKTAWYNGIQGRYETAYRDSLESYNIRQKLLDENSLEILSTLSLIMLMLRGQGKYVAAEKMGRRALDGWEKALGKEHPITLTSVDDVASVLQYQGKYEAAEMHRRALDGGERVLGKEHPATLLSVNDLALILLHQGKFEAAEELCRRAFNGMEKALGKEHPNTLMSVNNLAIVLRHQGKYEAAEEMYRRALNGSEKALGKEHPDTLSILNNLALVLVYQGKFLAGEELCRQALNGRSTQIH